MMSPMRRTLCSKHCLWGLLAPCVRHCGADVLLAVENYDFNTCITVDDGRDA